METTKIRRSLNTKLTILLLCISCLSSAQSTEVQPSWQLNGMVGVNISSRGEYLTFGGPGLTFKRKKSGLFIGLLPAIKMDHSTFAFRPSVGGGIRYNYKNFAVMAPVAYFDQGRWEIAFGLGYIFNVKKEKK